jgi:hypothetical protein
LGGITVLVQPEYSASEEYSRFWQALNRGEFQAGEFERLTNQPANPGIIAFCAPFAATFKFDVYEIAEARTAHTVERLRLNQFSVLQQPDRFSITRCSREVSLRWGCIGRYFHDNLTPSQSNATAASQCVKSGRSSLPSRSYETGKFALRECNGIFLVVEANANPRSQLVQTVKDPVLYVSQA